MTTRWNVPRLFEGRMVAVLAPGKNLTQELADSVVDLPRIAVKRAYRLAPDADMLIGLDGTADAEFWTETDDFDGLRVCGTECDLDVLYLHLPHEVVTLAPGHVIHIRNNGLAAIRVAAMAGASKILLLGFDTGRYEAFHGFRGLTEGLAQLTAELQARGVAVERIDE